MGAGAAINSFDALKDEAADEANADAVSWLEVPGNGVFTVNLRAGEFIIIRAKESTQKMLVNLVRHLNPQLPDLVVEIEFIDRFGTEVSK